MSTYLIHIPKAYYHHIGNYYSVEARNHINLQDITNQHFEYENYKDEPATRAFRHNTYLFDISNDSIETLRHIVNRVIEAESYLFAGDFFPYVLVYEMQLGDNINDTTLMSCMVNVAAKTSQGWMYVSGGQRWSTGTQPRVRHTLRGNGRYEPVVVKDTPEQWTQDVYAYTAPGGGAYGRSGPFMGLNVAFGTVTGRARRLAYMGAPYVNDYQRGVDGSILLHRGGPLRAGLWRLYTDAIGPLVPMMSPYRIDAEGYLVDAVKIDSLPVPTGVSEFKMQLHRSKDRGFWPSQFRRQLMGMFQDYVSTFIQFVREVNAWGHNLNYSVEGFRLTKILYEKAEFICRRIANIYPNQLLYEGRKFSTAYNLNYCNDDMYLLLMHSTDAAIETFDAMCKKCDWMRGNFVDYTLLKAPAKYAGGTNLGDRTVYSYTGFKPHWQWSFSRYDFSRPEIPVNQAGRITKWMYETAGTAADIEQVYLTFQINAKDFIPMLAHFIRCCESTSYFPHENPKGPYNGMAPMSEEMKKNQRRVSPHGVDVPRIIPHTEEQQNSRAGKMLLPNFAPLQIDDRPIIARCGKDTVKKSDGEEEEDNPNEPDFDEELEREKRKKREEMKKIKAKRAPIEWRNEIDPLDAETIQNEDARMLNQMIDNVDMVTDVAEVALDLATVSVAPPLTPAIVAKRTVSQTWKKIAKKVAKDILEEAIEEELQPRFPEVPEPEGGLPDPHNYDPPERSANPERTGHEEGDFPELDDLPWEESYCQVYVSAYGGYQGVFIKRKMSGLSREALEAIEPSLGRKLIQEGLHFEGEVHPNSNCETWNEDDDKQRYKCLTVPPRLPRRQK